MAPLDPVGAGAPVFSSFPPVRVMVVDDSAVIRGLLSRFIDAETDMIVVATADNGQSAVDACTRHPVDVVILDIDMPVMDGMEALQKIRTHDETIAVIMASTLTRENAGLALKCLAMGALDSLAKPTTSLSGAETFRRLLIEKVRALGRARHKKAGMPAATGQAPAAPFAAGKGREQADVSLLPMPVGWGRPAALAVGASTGGPQALLEFFKGIGGGVLQPIFVTQHMPPMFTTILAETIRKTTGLACAEAVDGEPVLSGRIYLAPGQYHMLATMVDGEAQIQLTQTPPENFCRPAVDPMLRSLSALYKNRLLTVILTGMGSDGLAGARVAVSSGGVVLAQDEASAVVWGMPGAVARAGLCTAVAPVEQIAKTVRGLCLPEKEREKP